MENIREKEIKIKSKDVLIYGTLCSSVKKTDKIVIFVHGFTGNRNEHIFFNGAKYFTNKGFDTFRFDLYSHKDGARHFENTKISLHGEDVQDVVNYFKDKYEKIYLVGHSYGGTSLLFVDPKNISAFVFWDASYIDWNEEQNDFIYDKNLDAYRINWGIQYVVGKGFVGELKNFPDCGDLVNKIDKPVLFITTGKGKEGNSRAGEKYYAKANEPKSLVNIEDADHNFNSLESEDKLLEETYGWITKY